VANVRNLRDLPKERWGEEGNIRIGLFTRRQVATFTHSFLLSNLPSESRTYDAIGNPLTVGARQLLYDDRANLDQVTLHGSDVWQYGYTGQGLRVTKRKADDASTLRHFVYDESAQLVGEYDNAVPPILSSAAT